jgi:hypothetical protein
MQTFTIRPLIAAFRLALAIRSFRALFLGRPYRGWFLFFVPCDRQLRARVVRMFARSISPAWSLAWCRAVQIVVLRVCAFGSSFRRAPAALLAATMMHLAMPIRWVKGSLSRVETVSLAELTQQSAPGRVNA